MYNNDIKSLEILIGRWEKSYCIKIWKKFVMSLESIENAVNDDIKEILEYLKNMRMCNRKMMERIQKRSIDVNTSLEEYNEFLEKYNISQDSLEERKNQVKQINKKIENFLEKHFQVQAEERGQLDESKQMKMLPLIRKTHLEQKAQELLTSILQYDIGKENLDLLEKYERISSDASKLEEKKKLYENAMDFRGNVNKIANEIQKKMVERYIDNNEMIKIVYHFINPHPFFRDIKIDNKGGTETNIKSTTGEDIFLDHVFSEAQMKVLSLSVFLGLNLSVKNSSFQQIYIDDPVQSMDDINMLSFIDLLRAIKVAKNINKNFVIGTHDDNFSKLLKMKFRHRSYIEYHLEAYSKEGPIVSINRNLV